MTDAERRSRMSSILDFAKSIFPDQGIMILVTLHETERGFDLLSGANLSIDSQRTVIECASNLLSLPPEGATRN